MPALIDVQAMWMLGDIVPEVLSEKASYGNKVDSFSAAVLLHFMTCGHLGGAPALTKVSLVAATGLAVANVKRDSPFFLMVPLEVPHHPTFFGCGQMCT